MATRFYFIPFDAPRPDGTVQPKYLNEFPRGRASGILPHESSPRTWAVPYYLVAVTAENDADFAALESHADVCRLWPDPVLATVRTTLQTAGVNVSRLKGQWGISEIKATLYEFMQIDSGVDHLALHGLV